MDGYLTGASLGTSGSSAFKIISETSLYRNTGATVRGSTDHADGDTLSTQFSVNMPPSNGMIVVGLESIKITLDANASMFQGYIEHYGITNSSESYEANNNGRYYWGFDDLFLMRVSNASSITLTLKFIVYCKPSSYYQAFTTSGYIRVYELSPK